VVFASGGVQLNNLVANPSVTIIGDQQAATALGPPVVYANTNVTLNLKDASGSTDVVNLRLDNLSTAPTGAAGVNGGTLFLGGNASAGQVETLNVVSAGKQSATGAYNSLTIGASGGAAPYADPNTINVSGSVGLTLNLGLHQHAQTVDASANTFGVSIISAQAVTGAEVIIGTASNDTININTAVGQTAQIYGGAGGDSFVLGNGTQTILYKAATDSVLDLAATAVGAGSGNAQAGVALLGTTKTTSGMDVITTFATGTDKIDVSTFGFGVGGLGGGIVDKGTATSDAQINTILTTGTGVNGVFGNGAIQRGLAVIHTTAATRDGIVSDILLIDVNKDGAFTAGSDVAVKFVGTPNLVITDFII